MTKGQIPARQQLKLTDFVIPQRSACDTVGCSCSLVCETQDSRCQVKSYPCVPEGLCQVAPCISDLAMPSKT